MNAKTDANPYAAPPHGESSDRQSVKAHEMVVDFRPIMRRWERLRLYYNATLVLLVLVLSFVVYPRHIADPEYWILVCVGGLFANVCYFAGPTLEAYGTSFRVWYKAFTLMLFFAGLGFTALLAFWTIATF